MEKQIRKLVLVKDNLQDMSKVMLYLAHHSGEDCDPGAVVIHHWSAKLLDETAYQVGEVITQLDDNDS